jgi:GT2 family glycosyltransferase
LDYNRLCINSIRKYTKRDSYEIIVVDNHSTDGTVEWLQEQADLRLILNHENVGFPAACNQGIAAANGNDIMLLNNDTIVTPQWLSNLEKCLYSSPDIGAVGTVTNSCSNFQRIACKYSSIEEMICFAQRFNHSDPGLWEERKRLVAYCMLIRAEVIDKVGLLDEIFSPGNYEDDDYSVRMRNAGYRLVLCRDAFVHHFGSISFREQSTQFTALLNTNKQKFIDKWGFAPHSFPSSNLVEEPDLKQWFAYEHDFNYHRQSIQNECHKFNSLLDQAEFALLTGDNEKAMSIIMNSANTAHHCHPGFFASPRLETLLRKIAKTISAQPTFPIALAQNRAMDKRNVLHVLSQGYSSGGHTKTLERWIQKDTKSTHSILVTLNSSTNPPGLANVAMGSGGWYLTLDKANLSLCQRAKLLRDMANMWADVVVLHIHPHDPIPPVAFGVDTGPQVIFVNHADQAFNIGMTSADIVAEHFVPGQYITQTRRNALVSHVLPIPLETPLPLEEKQIAKRNLGINEEHIVFLTVAQSYRLVPCGEYNFIKLLKEISSRHENVTLLVIGSSEAGEWGLLNRESNGRIRVMASQNDLRPYHSAADVYLDSLPFGSPVEALEAGVLGIPVIGLATAIAARLSSDIAPGNIQTHFTNREELFSVIDKLVSDASYRRNRGDCLQAAILQNHCSSWTEHLERLYALLPGRHSMPEILPAEEQIPDKSDIIWAYFQQQSGLSNCRF